LKICNASAPPEDRHQGNNEKKGRRRKREIHVQGSHTQIETSLKRQKGAEHSAIKLIRFSHSRSCRVAENRSAASSGKKEGTAKLGPLKILRKSVRKMLWTIIPWKMAGIIEGI